MITDKPETTSSSDVRTAVPYARWVPYESDPETHVFIASAVLTTDTLEKYIGNSRKYSVVQ